MKLEVVSSANARIRRPVFSSDAGGGVHLLRESGGFEPKNGETCRGWHSEQTHRFFAISKLPYRRQKVAVVTC